MLLEVLRRSGRVSGGQVPRLSMDGIYANICVQNANPSTSTGPSFLPVSSRHGQQTQRRHYRESAPQIQDADDGRKNWNNKTKTRIMKKKTNNTTPRPVSSTLMPAPNSTAYSSLAHPQHDLRYGRGGVCCEPLRAV